MLLLTQSLVATAKYCYCMINDYYMCVRACVCVCVDVLSWIPPVRPPPQLGLDPLGDPYVPEKAPPVLSIPIVTRYSLLYVCTYSRLSVRTYKYVGISPPLATSPGLKPLLKQEKNVASM